MRIAETERNRRQTRNGDARQNQSHEGNDSTPNLDWVKFLAHRQTCDGKNHESSENVNALFPQKLEHKLFMGNGKRKKPMGLTRLSKVKWVTRCRIGENRENNNAKQKVANSDNFSFNSHQLPMSMLMGIGAKIRNAIMAVILSARPILSNFFCSSHFKASMFVASHRAGLSSANWQFALPSFLSLLLHQPNENFFKGSVSSQVDKFTQIFWHSFSNFLPLSMTKMRSLNSSANGRIWVMSKIPWPSFLNSRSNPLTICWPSWLIPTMGSSRNNKGTTMVV